MGSLGLVLCPFMYGVLDVFTSLFESSESSIHDSHVASLFLIHLTKRCPNLQPGTIAV